jgi:hypothetical protein
VDFFQNTYKGEEREGVGATRARKMKKMRGGG